MATKEYLDKTGLTYFWGKIKAALSGKQNTLTDGSGISIANDVVSIDYADLGTAIKDNDDLNTYTTPGTYYSSTATRSATLTNTPHKSSGFKLVVENTSADVRYRQTIYANDDLSSTYYRTYTATGWSNWVASRRCTDATNMSTLIVRGNASSYSFTLNTSPLLTTQNSIHNFLLWTVGVGSSDVNVFYCCDFAFGGTTHFTSMAGTSRNITSLTVDSYSTTYNTVKLTVTFDGTVYGGIHVLSLG